MPRLDQVYEMASYYESSAPGSDIGVYGILGDQTTIRSHEHAGVRSLGWIPPCDHQGVDAILGEAGHIEADRVHFVRMLDSGRMGVNIWEAHLNGSDGDSLRKVLVVVKRGARTSGNPADGAVRRELEVLQQLQGNLAHVPELYGGCLDHHLPYLIHEYFPYVTRHPDPALESLPSAVCDEKMTRLGGLN
jgi:hypothetical protein